MGLSTTHSLSAPYVSASATNVPRVSPYVSSKNCTEMFSDLVVVHIKINIMQKVLESYSLMTVKDKVVQIKIVEAKEKQ